jgi:hypothetical protein
MERDNRKTFPNKEEDEYIHNIINMLIDQIFLFASNLLGKQANKYLFFQIEYDKLIPPFKDDCINALESVYGRKNPSTAQTKHLKRAIPNMAILRVLLTNQVRFLSYLN